MKSGRFFVSTVLLLVLVGVGLKLLPVNEYILRSDAPLWLKRVIELLIPPEDLFDPIKVRRTTFKQLASGIVLEFQHKYEGPYHVFIIYLPKGRTSREEWDGSLYCVGDGSHLRKSNIVINNPVTTKYGSGLHVVFYNVPNELPSGEAVECRLEVRTGYNADPKPGQAARVVVARISRAI